MDALDDFLVHGRVHGAPFLSIIVECYPAPAATDGGMMAEDALYLRQRVEGYGVRFKRMNHQPRRDRMKDCGIPPTICATSSAMPSRFEIRRESRARSPDTYSL